MKIQLNSKKTNKWRRKIITRKRKNTTGIPDYEIESIARVLLPEIQQMFEKEEVKQEFEKWLAERQKLQFNKTNDNKNSPVETIGTPQENT